MPAPSSDDLGGRGQDNQQVDATFDGVWGAARPFAETWLSDELFFEALKASSVAKLIRDENFDRIVVAVDGSPASAELCGVLGTVEGFASDPRVVVASLALTENARLRFGDEISAILGNAHGAPNKRRALVSSAIVDMLKVRGKELVGGFKQFPVAGRPRILFATAPEPSYRMQRQHPTFWNCRRILSIASSRPSIPAFPVRSITTLQARFNIFHSRSQITQT